MIEIAPGRGARYFLQLPLHGQCHLGAGGPRMDSFNSKIAKQQLTMLSLVFEFS